MDYGRLIRDAWTMTWRYRFLWVLGLFAGTNATSCSGVGNRFSLPTGGPSTATAPPSPEVGRAIGAVTAWITSHPGLVALAAGFVLLIILALFALSLIAQAGLTRATIDLARNRPITLGGAWRAGTRFFWRFLGLTLLLIAAILVLSIIAGVGLALAIGTSMLAQGTARSAIVAIWIVLGLIFVILLIPIGVAVSIVIRYAQREIVADDIGAIAAARTGWQLLRTRPGPGVIVWLINLGLGIVAGLAVVLAGIAFVAALGLIGVIVWLIAGWTAVTFVYIGLAVLATIGALWGMQAVANTFFWSYWTLAYLRLREEAGSVIARDANLG